MPARRMVALVRWMTEITRWERVPEERHEQRAALARE